jgi:hypothetical protein
MSSREQKLRGIREYLTQKYPDPKALNKQSSLQIFNELVKNNLLTVKEKTELKKPVEEILADLKKLKRTVAPVAAPEPEPEEEKEVQMEVEEAAVALPQIYQWIDNFYKHITDENDSTYNNFVRYVVDYEVGADQETVLAMLEPYKPVVKSRMVMYHMELDEDGFPFFELREERIEEQEEPEVPEVEESEAEPEAEQEEEQLEVPEGEEEQEEEPEVPQRKPKKKRKLSEEDEIAKQLALIQADQAKKKDLYEDIDVEATISDGLAVVSKVKLQGPKINLEFTEIPVRPTVDSVPLYPFDSMDDEEINRLYRSTYEISYALSKLLSEPQVYSVPYTKFVNLLLASKAKASFLYKRIKNRWNELSPEFKAFFEGMQTYINEVFGRVTEASGQPEAKKLLDKIVKQFNARPGRRGEQPENISFPSQMVYKLKSESAQNVGKHYMRVLFETTQKQIAQRISVAQKIHEEELRKPIENNFEVMVFLAVLLMNPIVLYEDQDLMKYIDTHNVDFAFVNKFNDLTTAQRLDLVVKAQTANRFNAMMKNYSSCNRVIVPAFVDQPNNPIEFDFNEFMSVWKSSTNNIDINTLVLDYLVTMKPLSSTSQQGLTETSFEKFKDKYYSSVELTTTDLAQINTRIIELTNQFMASQQEPDQFLKSKFRELVTRYYGAFDEDQEVFKLALTVSPEEVTTAVRRILKNKTGTDKLFAEYNIEPKIMLSLACPEAYSVLQDIVEKWKSFDLRNKVNDFKKQMKTKFGDLSGKSSEVRAEFDKLSQGNKLDTTVKEFLAKFFRYYDSLSSLPTTRTQQTFQFKTLNDFPKIVHRQILDRTFAEAGKRQQALDELLRTNKTQDQTIAVVVQRLQILNDAISNLVPEEQLQKLRQGVKEQIANLKLSTYLDVDKFIENFKARVKDIMRQIPFKDAKEVEEDVKEMLQTTANMMRQAEVSLQLTQEKLGELQETIMDKKYAEVASIVGQIEELLRRYSKSENIVLQQAVDNNQFPVIYRALAVYRRQVGKNTLINQLKLINPLESNPEFELRNQRRQQSQTRLPQIISNLTQIPVNKLQFDLTSQQTKPWLDYDSSFKWIIALPQVEAQPASLEQKDPRKRFFGRFTNVENYYFPSYAFWTFYKSAFGGFGIQGFDQECNMTEKMTNYFLNPASRQLVLGLLDENTEQTVWLTSEDFRKECEYYKRRRNILDLRVEEAPQFIRACKPQMISKLALSIEQFRKNKDLLIDAKQQSNLIIEGLFECGQNERATYRAIIEKYNLLKFLFESSHAQYFQTLFIRMNKQAKSLLWYFEMENLLPEIWLLENEGGAAFKQQLENLISQQAILFSNKLRGASGEEKVLNLEIVISQIKNNIAEFQSQKHQLFMTDQKDVLKQQCKNTIKGDVIFYYLSEDKELFCAGFDEINQVIHPDESETTDIPADIQDIIKRLFALADSDYDANFSEIRIQVLDSLDQYLKQQGKTYFPSKLITEVYKANEQIRTYSSVVDVDVNYPELSEIIQPLRLQTPQLKQQALEILVNHVYMEYRKKLVQLIEDYTKTEEWQTRVKPELQEEAQMRATQYGAEAQRAINEQTTALRQPRAQL